jgi:two-component system, cell cycle sensor histidine kinase and response regulator CckA
MSSADPSSPEYRAVFDSAPGNFLLLDPALTIVGVTDAYCAATMTVRDQILGRHIFDVFPDNPSDPAATGVRNLRASLDRVLEYRKANRMPLQRYDIRRPASEGGGFEERYWSPLNCPVLGPDGSLRHIIHAVEDVTEVAQLKRKLQEDETLRAELRQSENQIEAEMSLRVEAVEANKRLGESERRYRFLADAVPQLVWTADATGAATYFNGRWVEFTGMTLDQLRGGGWWSAIHPEDVEPTVRAWEQALREGADRYQVEHRLRRHDGTYRRMFTVAQPYRGPDRTVLHWFGSTTDIHDRAVAEEQLRQAQRLQAVGKLAGGMAHEVNNMMTGVIGFSEFVLRTFSEDDPRRGDIQEIIRAGTRASDVTRQLLAFTRQQLLHPEVLDVNSVVTGVEKMLRRSLGEDHLLELALAPEAGEIRADRGQLEQVLLNLTLNARDAMHAHGRVIVATGRATLDEVYAQSHGGIGVPPGEYVFLSVGDTGTGMAPEVQARIFEPFFTTKPVGHGTGLGLSTVYGIVKQSDGFIWCYSEPGHGSTFKVYLPLANARSVPSAPAASPSELRGGTETILVVEDEDVVRALACRGLREQGYTVIEARHGREALDRVEQNRHAIDLIISDVVMPGLGGRELGSRLAVLQPDLPVLFMSGYTGDDVIQRGLLEPGVPFQQKPFTPEGLARKVREMLDGRGAGRRASAV